MTIATKGTVHEKEFEGEEVKILFDGEAKTIEYIRNSTWYLIKKSKNKDTFYVQTGNYKKTKKPIKLHQAVFNQNIPHGYVINHINRKDGGWTNNRLRNLELLTIKENSKNRVGAGYPKKTNNGWFYQINVGGFKINTPTKQSYLLADIDALIIQKHFDYKHRKSEWEKIDEVDPKYIKELIIFMEQKLEKIKKKGLSFIRNEYQLEKIGEIEVAKVFDTKGRFCFIDKEDLWILDKGRLSQTKDYWEIKINDKKIRLHRYLVGIQTNDIGCNLQVDHIIPKTNLNIKDNLLITTENGNKANKKGLGYVNVGSYKVQYSCYHHYLKQHKEISNAKKPYFKTETEAILEVKRRKWLANYIRPQFKTYQDYLIFKEEYELNNKNNLSIDDYWITTRFSDINSIKIPKFSEEEVDKL